LEPIDELAKVLDTLDKALALLTRLETVPPQHAVYIKQSKTKLRWAARRLAKRAWILSMDIQVTDDTDESYDTI
jgi:hypothetical protein